MSAIGGYDVLTIKGNIGRPGVIVKPITRPGVDGSAAMDVGYRAAISEVESTAICTSLEAAESLSAIFKAMQGATIGFTLDTGRLLDYVLVHECEQEEIRPVGLYLGLAEGTSGALLRTRWRVEDVS